MPVGGLRCDELPWPFTRTPCAVLTDYKCQIRCCLFGECATQQKFIFPVSILAGINPAILLEENGNEDTIGVLVRLITEKRGQWNIVVFACGLICVVMEG